MEFLMSKTGSKGNASVITDGETLLQIDCGIGYKKVNELCDYKLYQCHNAIITHKHSDHAKNTTDFIKHGMNVWATVETWNDAFMFRGKTHYRTFRAGEQFEIESLVIKPFHVFHTNNDGSECENCGFLIYSKSTKEKLLWITDTSYVENIFPAVDYIAIECNYIDIEDYKEELPYINEFVEKRRLQSHMSLNHCIQFLQKQDLSKIKEIHLIHVSHNQPNTRGFIIEKLRSNFPNIQFIM